VLNSRVIIQRNLSNGPAGTSCSRARGVQSFAPGKEEHQASAQAGDSQSERGLGVTVGAKLWVNRAHSLQTTQAG